MFATAFAPASSGTPIPCPTPQTSSTFTLLVSNTTRILLSDRGPTTLANIAPGDSINAFGYYDGLGTLEASVVRSLGTGAASDIGNPGISLNGQSISLAQIETAITQIENVINQLIQEITTLQQSSSTASSTTAAPMIPNPTGALFVNPSSTNANNSSTSNNSSSGTPVTTPNIY